MPSTDVNPFPGGPGNEPAGIGTVGPLGAPPATPLVHTPLKRVGTVP
jgi:hypothetical protein